MNNWNGLRYIGGGLDECEAFTDGKHVFRAIPNNPRDRNRWKDIHDIIQSDDFRKLVDLGLIQPIEKTDIDPANCRYTRMVRKTGSSTKQTSCLSHSFHMLLVFIGHGLTILSSLDPSR